MTGQGESTRQEYQQLIARSCRLLQNQPAPCPPKKQGVGRPGLGNMRIKLEVVAHNPCPDCGGLGDDNVKFEFNTCKTCDGTGKVEVGRHVNEEDLATIQFAQLVQLNILATNETITDTASAGHAETANAAASAPTIVAGTGSTAAAYNDVALGTQTETQAATVNALKTSGGNHAASGSGTSSSFTVTGTITAGSARAYAEVGLRVTVNSHTYLICRNVFSVLNVSNGGTLAVTYTLTFS